MKKLLIIFLSGIIGVSTSCSSQLNEETSLILNETKTEINNYLDSTNYFLDLAITDHEKGINNSEIEKKYNKKIMRLESKISEALEKPNQLGRERKLTQREYEKWMNGIELTLVVDKIKKIKSLGIDINKLVITNNYDLKQHHVDSTNHFSLSFPENWTITNDFQGNTLMGLGPLNNDTSSQMKRQGGFGLNISKLKKDISTSDYYRSNISALKRDYPDFRIIEETTIILNGIQTKYIAHQCTEENMLITSIQFYFTSEKLGYVLNGSVVGEDIEKYRELYVEIARTFRLSEK